MTLEVLPKQLLVVSSIWQILVISQISQIEMNNTKNETTTQFSFSTTSITFFRNHPPCFRRLRNLTKKLQHRSFDENMRWKFLNPQNDHVSDAAL